MLEENRKTIVNSGAVGREEAIWGLLDDAPEKSMNMLLEYVQKRCDWVDENIASLH